MDTLFRLVSLQSDQSTTTSTTSTSHPQLQDQECFNNFYMDEDFSSSSSSSKPTPNPPTHHHAYTQSTHQFSYSPANDVTIEFPAPFSGQSNWASDLLLETAKAVADRDSGRVQHLMWMLNEVSSPYGDLDQKVSSYFLQALFARVTDCGGPTRRSLISAAERSCSFDSMRSIVLKFQEVSPWTTFGHVACNAAIMEAVEGEEKIHIIDISNTFCTQWPTLLEAIATRADDTLRLRITAVVGGRGDGAAAGAAALENVMREIGNRMEKFARLMGVPFQFNVVHHAGDLSTLDLTALGLVDGEAVAVNCNGALRSVTVNKRDSFVSIFRTLIPKILTVVEEEADLDVGPDGAEFVRGFQECVRWIRVYFEALDESFQKTSNERLMLERAAGRAVVDLVACPAAGSVERRDTAARWARRLRGGGFKPASFNEEVCDDVRALLRRYREGWSMGHVADRVGYSLIGRSSRWFGRVHGNVVDRWGVT